MVKSANLASVVRPGKGRIGGVACIVAFVLFFTIGAGHGLLAQDITITWWINPWRIEPPGFPEGQAPEAEDFPQWISEQFMALHPHVKVEFEIVTNAGFNEKVTAAILAGTTPDIIKGFKQQWVARDLLEPIDEYLSQEDWDDFYDYALAEGRVGGQHYVFPWNNSNNGMGSAMLLNPRLFEEAGVDMPALPDRSWTVDEFLTSARKLTRDFDGDGINDQYALSLAATDTHNNLAWMHIFGAQMFNEEETALAINTPEAARGLQFMVDMMYEEQIAPRGAEGMGIYDVIGLFHQEKTAIGYGGPYEIGRIDRYVKSGQLEEAFPVHIAPFPHLPEVGPVAYYTTGGFSVFKQRDAAKKEMVMEFAKFLTNQEHTALLKSLLYVTARKSVNEHLYDGEIFEDEIDVYTRAIEHGLPYFGSAEVDFSPLEKHLEALFEGVFARSKTPEQALADFVRTGNRLLGR